VGEVDQFRLASPFRAIRREASKSYIIEKRVGVNTERQRRLHFESLHGRRNTG